VLSLFERFSFSHTYNKKCARATISRPCKQVVLQTKSRRDLCDFPVPAYELADLRRYLIGSIQFSSGCPYTCEFCDIPRLYGRVPRLKTPAQTVAELDKLLASGVNGAIYFVDDNLSPTGALCASYCLILSNGKSATAMQYASFAKRLSTSPACRIPSHSCVRLDSK
jgi:hypothetical protein